MRLDNSWLEKLIVLIWFFVCVGIFCMLLMMIVVFLVIGNVVCIDVVNSSVFIEI